jgi:hypothetical protein
MILGAHTQRRLGSRGKVANQDLFRFRHTTYDINAMLSKVV